MASSDTGGVNPMTIGGRMAHERERLIGMTDAERAFRAKFVKSQNLAPDEPIIPEGYNKALYNPLRRFYRAPLNILENALAPMVGGTTALVVRNMIGRTVIGIFVVYWGWYYYRHNTATWERQSGWRAMKSRETLHIRSPDFPKIKGVLKPNEYATFGFEKSPI